MMNNQQCLGNKIETLTTFQEKAFKVAAEKVTSWKILVTYTEIQSQ